MSDKQCPTQDELKTYAQRMLPVEQAEELTKHIAKCHDCEETVQEIASASSNNLVALIKASEAAQPYVDEPACLKVVESVKRSGPTVAGASTPGAAAGSNPPNVETKAARTMNRNEFVEFITTIGFVTTGDVTLIDKQLPAEKAGDVQALAQALVQQGKLSKFQAAAVYQGKGKSLVYGDYLVLDRLGAGGMGQVFKARHRRLDRIVALKVLSPAAMKSPDSVKRFEREARAAAKLIHPNIVHTYDAGAQDNVHYLVMELVSGPDLSSLVKKQGKLDVKLACDYIAQAARGFAFAHSKGIVHRDIKPGNLLVDQDGTVKVLDMGLARFDDAGLSGGMGEAELTQSGAVMGTVDYMAPEQALNTSRADAKSDVYGLGCTLYRILTGESVFAGDTLMEKLLAHREQPIPKLRRVRPDAPPALEALIARMLSKKPEERPTMQEVADALPGTIEPGIAVQPMQVRASAVATTGVPAMGAVKPKPKGAVPPKGRSKLPLFAAAGAGGLLILGGILFVIRDKDGNKIVEVNAPDGSSVAVQTDAPTHNPTGMPPDSTRPTGTPIQANPTPKPAAPMFGSAEPTATASAPQVASVTPAMPDPTPAQSSVPLPPAVSAVAAPSSGGVPARAVVPFDAAQAKSLQASWAAFLGQQEVVENAAGIKLVLIPAGEFRMGSTQEQQAAALMASPDAKYEKEFVDAEAPQHRVVLRSAFRMSATEVTIGQFRRFVEATKYKTECEDPANADPSDVGRVWHAPSYPVTDQCPATCITWNDAAAFCNWLSTSEGLAPAYRSEGPWNWSVGTTANGYRLPTEAEWEFASRAGTTTQFWYGDDYAKIPEFAVTAPGAQVASKPANPFGLYDTSGGVWEWCQDVYDVKPYEPGTAEDPTGPTSLNANANRIIRGGTWRNPVTTFRSAARCWYVPKSRNHHTGFRIVKVLGAASPAATTVATATTATSTATPTSIPVAAPAAPAGGGTSDHSSPTEPLAFEFTPPAQEIAVGTGYNIQLRVRNTTSQEIPLTGVYHHSDMAKFRHVAAAQARLQCLEPGPEVLTGPFELLTPATALGAMIGCPPVTSANKVLAAGEVITTPFQIRFISSLPVGRYVLTLNCVPQRGLGRQQYATLEFRITAQAPAAAEPAKVAWSFTPPASLASAPKLLPIADPERRAMIWSVALGSKNRLTVNGMAKDTRSIPEEPFTVWGIDFRENASYNESRRMITDADLVNIAGLRDIQYLRIPFTQITDIGMKEIGTLATVKTLDLDGTKITDSGIAKLAALKEIKSLRLNGTEITDAGLQKIVAQFPMVSEPLEVNDTRVTDAGAAHLKNAMYVRYVGLAGTEVTDACVADLAAIPRLAGVNLIGTRVTEAGVAKLKGLLGDRTVEIGFDPTKVKTGPRTTPIVNVPFASTAPSASTTPTAPAAGTPSSTSSTEAPAAPAGPSRLAVPDTKAQQAALQLIKDVYKDDYAAARVPDKKAELAEKLLEQSTQTTDPTDRYVLLNEARTFALDGDNQSLLGRVLTAIVTDFNVDTATIYIDSWKGVLAKTRPAAVARGIYDEITAMFESAVAQGAFDEAKRFGDYALTVAPRIGDATAVKSTRDRNTLLAARQQEWNAAKAALAKLAASPDDGEANLIVGRYRASVEGDWPNAFTHLARSSDETWKELATKSVSVAADGAARATLADAFWDASTKAKGPGKAEFAAAALYWYQAAIPSLSGLQKVRIDKRIVEATAAVPAKKLPPTVLGGAGTTTAEPAPNSVPRAIPGTTAAAPAVAVGLPPADPRGPLGNAVYQKWLNEVAAMPAPQQVEAVSKKMVELNPGFDGKLAPRIQDGIVKEVNFVSTNVTNIYPIRAFPGLTVLICNGVQSKLFDLLPIQGMPLTSLQFTGTSVSDLSPLRGMRLTLLSVNNTQVSDLSLLRGMPLTLLNCGSTPVFDLAPLQDCKQLETLDSYGSKVQPTMVDALRQVLPNCKFR